MSGKRRRGRWMCGSSPRRTGIWKNRRAVGRIPGRSLLPAQCRAAETSPSAREDGGYPVARSAFSEASSEVDAVKFSRRPCARLRTYPWKGNVRELENVIERAVILARGGSHRQLHHLPEEFQALPSGDSSGAFRWKKWNSSTSSRSCVSPRTWTRRRRSWGLIRPRSGENGRNTGSRGVADPLSLAVCNDRLIPYCSH